MASCLLLQPTGFVTKYLHSGVHRGPPGPHARDHLGRIRGLRCRTPRVQRRGRTFTCWSTPKYEMSGIHRFGMLLSAVVGPAVSAVSRRDRWLTRRSGNYLLSVSFTG